MKGEIKNKYIEFINHIDFPTVLYVYESNKIIAMNGYAIEIIGKCYDDIRPIFDGKKFRLPKEVIDGENKIFNNVKISLANSKVTDIDMDINVFEVDNVHFVLMLFEESFKKIFASFMNVHAVRVAWKYKDRKKIYMNQILDKDIEGTSIEECVDESMLQKFEEIKESIIGAGVCQYNSIQMIVKRDKSNHFIKANRMPIINSVGDNIGILNVHNIILDKNANRKLYDNVLQGINTGTKTTQIIEKKGIPDRIKFAHDVKDYIINAIERNSNGTMIMFRLENFEHIKYNVGALYIEELIKQFEQEISNQPLLENSCYKSRNIEYIVLLQTEEQSKVEEIILLINKLFNGERTIKDKNINCEINIGITHFPKDGIKSTALLKNVDFAIFEAKNDEGTNCKYYEMTRRI